MNSSSNSNEFRDFLLDRLPPEQAEAIEERMFHDEAYFSDLQDAEDDLIEEYAMDALSPVEAQIFEARVERDPELQDRVTLRRALVRTLQQGGSLSVAAAAERSRPQQRAWNRFLVPGFALAIVIVFFLSYKAEHRNGLPPREPETAAAPAPRSTGARPQALSQTAAVLFLPAHVARGASQAPSLLHLGNAGIVRLELETPSADGQWEVGISDGGVNVFSAEGLKPQQAGVVSYVVAEVPASQLPPKVYRVSLSPQSSGAVGFSWDLAVAK